MRSKQSHLVPTAIGIGRPYVYGLSIAGEQGVYEVLRNLLADFELTMALAGCRNIRESRRKYPRLITLVVQVCG